MAAFHVYVEGPVDRSPEGIERLAVAISQKYGLPVPDLVKRMTAGRFRVKANIDAATADAYARALEEVGARVKVEEATPTVPVPIVEAPNTPPTTLPPPLSGEKPTRAGRYSVSPPLSSARTAAPTTTPARGVPPPTRSKTPSTSPDTPPREGHPSSQLMPVSAAPPRPPASASVAPPAAAARPGSSSLPPATSAPARPGAASLPPPNTARSTTPPANAKNTPFQSGLSAAFSQEVALPADLGALGDASFSLASLDGNDDPSESPDGSFGPPPSPGMAASIGPPPEPAPAAKFKTPTTPAAPAAPAARPKDMPLDLFAPPDAEEAEQKVDLAVDEERPKKTSIPPEPRGKAPTATPATQQLTPTPPPGMRKQPVSAMGGVSAPEMPRTRFAAGVVLSIILGFIPAHLIAASRESSAFKKIDAQIIATQAAADTPEMYAALDSFRDAQLARKASERRTIALTSMLIWGVVAAGLGYVWFRRIPWDRFPSA